MIRFWNKVKKAEPDECWEWQAGCCRDGYGTFHYNGKSTGAHCVSYLLTKGEIPLGMVVMHTCDNPPCCNPSHLKLGTHKDNAHDAIKKGRFSPLQKIFVGDVREIRRLYAVGSYTYEGLGTLYGVLKPMICRIVNRNNWKHIK